MSSFVPRSSSNSEIKVILDSRKNWLFKIWNCPLQIFYLGVAIFVVGGGSFTLHYFFRTGLQRQFDQQLLTLTQAAVSSLDKAKTKSHQDLDRDLPWQTLFSHRQQGIEWFDENGVLLTREGSRFIGLSLLKNSSLIHLQSGSPVFQEQDQLRTITISVYEGNASDQIQKNLKLKGYIRVSESTQNLQAEFNLISLILVVHGIIILVLIQISAMHLRWQTLLSITQNVQQMKQFINDISHHLRHPLTQISIASDLMINDPEQMSAADIKKLAIITGASEQMQRLVDDLFFLARTEMLIPTTQAIASLDDLLKNLIEQFRTQAQQKGILLQVQLQSGLSVKGDETQLNRLFGNLLENALKYSKKGGTIALSVEKLRTRVVVVVKDTGIGIPSECQWSVFQRFWRSEQEQVQQQEGLGLGLVIAQAIAKQHGGEITFSSQLGLGSTFQVKLPLL